MKIGVVSDTHSLAVPARLVQDLKQVDLIIHAGDLCSEKDLEFFKKIKPVKAVLGNMDDKSLAPSLPQRQIIPCGEIKIGLMHGYGAAKDVLKNVIKEFKQEKVQLVIFGHSHQPFQEKINNVWYFNPGSPTDMVRAPYCSYGLIEINGKEIMPKIIKL